MPGIFISYRREIDAGWAGRLAADLKQELPDKPVFQDIASIEIGEDFGIAIEQALGDCAVLLVVIGPRWLDARHPDGGRRLDDADDWVRLEIITGLRGRLRVVPILVGGAAMPPGDKLPEPLKSLARRAAHEITDRRWDYDVGELVKALRRIPPLAEGTGVSAPAPQPGLPAASPTQPPRQPGKPPSQVPGTGSQPAPGTLLRHGPHFPELVVVPAGRFLMGSPDTEKGRSNAEGPLHEVCIARPLAVGRYPVTFAEWDAFVATGATCYKPADQDWGRGRQPAVNLSWDDARSYTAWLCEQSGRPYRLLSEAEWEYAARAGSQTRYPWGEEPGAGQANFLDSGSPWSGRQTSPVGSFAANAFGLHDMIGNIWEWVQDNWHDTYAGAPDDGSAREDGRGLRVLRGGSWDLDSAYGRAASRDGSVPEDRLINLGFRVCCELPPA
ncbi:SUMF1/EgtB/PvdO family nonheme iron enzyme [Zoogloea sp.]|uniref:SUMF1/EgtB/PvdO family nonheme iron enzyme n=1 Tax=Zoogloea sp. TaxID=49181 RepID=UPI001415D84E|nr:MAG: SUMF1/EgtB/PvdO family nonheme iron enzyme [Zoogloea sp.]